MKIRSVAPLAMMLVVASACHRSVVVGSVSGMTQAGVASGQRAWTSLSNASAWRGYKTDAIPSAWTFTDGVLSKSRPVADIVSKDEYGNFELELEWKIGEAGNSGIFYRGTEEYDHIYWSGPEYQLLDNIKADDNKTPLTRAGAAYGLYPGPDGHVKPIGEWNQTRIVVNGNHVEHWLNGFKQVEYELGSADWKAKVATSKFGKWPNYGLAKKGHIALQGDHNGALAFRNIRVRELP